MTLSLVAWLGMATPLVTVLFTYFALQKLTFRGSKALALLLGIVFITAAGFAFVNFSHQAVHAFPRIAEKSIPAITKYAEQHNVDLPFTDWESLRSVTMDTVMEQFEYLGKRATLFGKHLLLVIVGVVIAIGLFLNPRLEMEAPGPGPNFYSLLCAEIQQRFRSLYESFRQVMGAQIIISVINTGLTSVFVTWIRLPYASLVLGVTLVCGLLPIIGNLISNTVIVCIAFTLSPRLGVFALVFLIVLHKLEYFLNSKIIGERIRNPMWLTLLALILTERLMGIPGLILAPVLLDYIKRELSKVPAAPFTRPVSAKPN
jgi:predicted PurR-regulated permease PerM